MIWYRSKRFCRAICCFLPFSGRINVSSYDSSSTISRIESKGVSASLVSCKIIRDLYDKMNEDAKSDRDSTSGGFQSTIPLQSVPAVVQRPINRGPSPAQRIFIDIPASNSLPDVGRYSVLLK